MSLIRQSERYEALDWLRGLAAIGVVLFHFSMIGLPVAPHGYLAVDFFFMLSGFVMSQAYYHRITDMRRLDFIKIRLIRIIPLSTLGLVMGSSYFVLRYATQSKSEYSINDILLGTLFNSALLPKPWITPTSTDTIFPTNTPLWSLSLEIYLNFIWAIFLVRCTLRSILFILATSALCLGLLAANHGTADIGATWPTYLGACR